LNRSATIWLCSNCSLHGIELGHVPLIDYHQKDVSFVIKGRGAGHQQVLVGFLDILHNAHLALGFQNLHGYGSVENPGCDKMGHILADDILCLQTVEFF
jgi:hypothetical protein